MVLHNGKGTRARNLNRYLHKNPPEADQVSAPGPSRTATGICIGTVGTLRNFTKYLNQHELIHTQSCWMTRCYSAVYGLVFVIMTWCAHCHTIIHIQVIQIQSYAYNHNHALMLHTGMWRIPMKKKVKTHNLQVLALHTVCVHNSVLLLAKSFMNLRQHCLWICGKQPTWTHTYAIIVDYTLLLTVYGLVIAMIEGSLEVKLPTIWTDEKQSREEAERRGRLEERRVEEKE